MAVVKMNKLSAAGFKETRDEFLKELMAFGFVEISSTDTQGFDRENIKAETIKESGFYYDRLITSSAEALKNLSKYAETKSPLILIRKTITNDDFLPEEEEEKTIKVINTINSLSQSIAAAENEINRLKSLSAGLKPWIKLEIDFNLEGTKYTDIILGTIPAKMQFDVLLADITNTIPSVVLSLISEDKQFRYICLICFKEERTKLLTLLREYSFTPLNKSDEIGTALQIISEHDKKISYLKSEIDNNKKSICEMVDEKEHIEYLYDKSVIGRDREKIVSNMIGTEKVFYFEGWIPEACKSDAEKLFEKYGYYYELREPYEDEEAPVLLSNTSLVEPFESVTSMYSLPSKNDIDPTKFLAPFYFIFFGLMLSDAAYGLIMSAACFIALKKFKLEGSMKKMVKMFFNCGISTFIWGALFGSWFGDIVAIVSGTFFGKTITLDPIWFAPMDEPMTLLIFSLILGAIHLFTGMAIQAYMFIKDGKPFDALFDIGLWYLLLIGLVMFAIGGIVAPILSTVGLIMSVVGSVGILFTGGRHKKGLFGKLTGGLGSLYGITSYLSDVLSYSRLLALGLATGVVASVVNQLGSLMGGGITGAIILIVVFIAGHTFNLAINALGAFVHACRLQYVEFFGKFYTGGGKPFKPFMHNTKYVKITEEEKDND